MYASNSSLNATLALRHILVKKSAEKLAGLFVFHT